MEEDNLMSVAQKQQSYKLRHKARLAEGKKTQDSAKKLEARVAVLEAKIYSSSNESSFAKKSLKAVTEITHPLTERESTPDKLMLKFIKREQPVQCAKKPLITVQDTVAQSIHLSDLAHHL